MGLSSNDAAKVENDVTTNVEQPVSAQSCQLASKNTMIISLVDMLLEASSWFIWRWVKTKIFLQR
jgi:hypothetical protein